MSLHRLSAGAGYRYLLRHTACGDVQRAVDTPLTSYYTASGYPPGRWLGRGLAGLAGGSGVPAGGMVTEEAMAALFGSGRDPVAGTPLGRAYPTYPSVEQRPAERVAVHPDHGCGEERAGQVQAIQTAERRRQLRAAVAGFDLTFTVPKSASVLWALGDPGIQRAVADAHRAAVDAALEVLQQRWLFTRVGAHSCAQVPTRGLVAAAFEHWDTRTGDPNLHTHVVIANRVQGPDGVWRSVDSRALHHAAVAVSELYDDFVADALAARLPVSWGWRPRGERRTPAFEIDGLDDRLLGVFSTRSQQVAERLRETLAGFRATRGRGPSRAEVLRLRQQATRASRPPKTAHPLPDLMACWRATASLVTGHPPQRITAAALCRDPRRRWRACQVGPDLVEALVDRTLAGVAERRSTWTRPNLVAEAARASRGLRMLDPQERLTLVDEVVAQALQRCVPLDPPELIRVPRRFRRTDGASVFTRPDERAYTTEAILAAEDRLLRAAEATGAPALQDRLVHAVTGLAPTGVGRRAGQADRGLTADQLNALRAVATSGRRVDVLVGPAGTGKTTTLRALREAWEAGFGPGSVLGLAPSASAAHELAQALGVACENTAKWLYESTGPGYQARCDLLDQLTEQRRQPLRPGAGQVLDQTRRALLAEQARWTLRPGQLLIVDEASLASTAALDELVRQAAAAHAKVLLVGDHHQLSAVDAAGAFRLLAESRDPATLTGLWRFRQRWEAHATRLVRAGNPLALDRYAQNRRIHEGPAETMLDAAYTAWREDHDQGRTALLVAPDTPTVTALNARAHDDRVRTGDVDPNGVRLHDGTIVGPGDRIVTRLNNRRVRLPGGGYVRNGALWQITAVHDDGSLTAAPLPQHTRRNPTTDGAVAVRLPARYVAEHVQLGYATTIHRAQGMTVDHAHVLAHPGMTRQALYVALTRGRASNHVYVAVDAVDPACPQPPDTGPAPTGRQVLETVLATDGAELSATATLRQRQDAATSLATLTPIRATLAAAGRDRWQRLLPGCGLDPAEVAAITSSPAAGALYATLDAGTELGHRMPRVLHQLIRRPLHDPADAARDAAAVLHARVTDWLANSPLPSGPPASAGVEALIGPSRCDAHTDPEVREAIADIDALITARLDDLLDRPDGPRATLGPPPSNPGWHEEWTQHVRTVTAHHDLTGPAAPPFPDDDDIARRRRLLAHQAATAARRIAAADHEGIRMP